MLRPGQGMFTFVGMKQPHQLSLLLFSILVLVTAPDLSAQTASGNWMVEGNLGNLSYGKSEQRISATNSPYTESQNFYFSLIPRVAYFLNDNLAIGTGLNFNYFDSRNISYTGLGVKTLEGSNTGSGIGISPFIREYFGKNSKNRFYVQLGGGLTTSLKDNSKGRAYDDTGTLTWTSEGSSKVQILFGEALVGYHHFFSEALALNASLGYTYRKSTHQYTYSWNQNGISSMPEKYEIRSLSSALVWNLGFSMFLTKQKK